MSALGPGSLAHLLDRKIQEASLDTDVQQWFHDSPFGPRPTQTAMVEDRSDRLLDEMVTQLGFDREELERLEAELLVAGARPVERAVAVGDEAVHRDAHRVDQHGCKHLA